jgi:hypothetical protein
VPGANYLDSEVAGRPLLETKSLKRLLHPLASGNQAAWREPGTLLRACAPVISVEFLSPTHTHHPVEKFSWAFTWKASACVRKGVIVAPEGVSEWYRRKRRLLWGWMLIAACQDNKLLLKQVGCVLVVL